MVNTSGENPNYYPVSTTRAYEGLTSSDGVNGTAEHTFYLLGRKVASTDPDVTVTDASTSVVCVQTIS
jgi:hypothetical protein